MKIIKKITILLFISYLLLSCSGKIKLDKNVILKKANHCYQIDDYKGALVLYNAYVKLDSTSGIAYFNKGYCEGRLSKYDASNESFDKAIELNYRIKDSYYNIAFNYVDEYNDSTALFYFKKAYSLDTTDMDIKEQIEIFTHRMNR